MARSFDGERSEGASGWVVQWREVCRCKWLGRSMERGLRLLVAGSFDGGRPEAASGQFVRWREV